MRIIGLFTAILFLAFTGALMAQGSETDVEPGTVTLFDFESQAQLDCWNMRELAHKSLIQSPWDPNGHALLLDIDQWSVNHEMWPAAIADGPAIAIYGQPDIYRKLSLKIKNIGETPAAFFLHFFNEAGLRYSVMNGSTTWNLSPGEEMNLSVNLRPGGIKQMHIATEVPKNSFKLAVDDIRVSPALDTIHDKVFTHIRNMQHWITWEIPDGRLRNRLISSITKINSQLAAIKSDYTNSKTYTPSKVINWLAQIDNVDKATQRLKCIPGKEKARSYAKEGWALGIESSMVKVSYDSLPFNGSFSNIINLDGARGESVHAQTVLIPVDNPLKSVRFAISNLTGPKGAVIKPAARVVGFLKTSFQDRYPVEYVGWWADPLLDNLKTFDVPQNTQQPVWVSVDIPEDASAGIYTGKLTVTPAGMRPRQIHIKLRVRSFEIPKERHLKLAISYEEKEAQRLHGSAWNDNMKWKYRNFLLQHRFNVDSIYQAVPMWDESVENLKRLKDAGQNFFVAAMFNNTNSPGWHEKVDAFMQRAKQAGIEDMCWFYGYDESGVVSKPDLLYHAKACHQYWPKAKVMTTADPVMMDDPEVADVIDAWVPITANYQRLQNKFPALRANGRQVWYYVCIGPGEPYANLFVERSPIEQRLLTGLMAEKSKTDGFLYYSLNRAPCNDKPINDGPLCKWNPASYQEYNGDGCLFYSGVNGPVSTIRFENMRDGLEDYEAIWLLKNLIQKARSNSRLVESVSQAEKQLEIPDTLVRNLEDFSYDPAKLESYRSRIYDSIEILSAKLRK